MMPTSWPISHVSVSPFFSASGRTVCTTFSDRFPQIEGCRSHLELARLDLGDVQDIVDQGEKMIGAVLHHFHLLFLFVVQRTRQAPGAGCR